MIIKNRFKFKRNRKYLIGKGGFGKVYIGKDLKTDEKIAVKVDELELNYQEYKIYKKLEYFDLAAKVLDYYKDQKNSYLIMPFYHKSCDKIFKLSDKYFTMKDVCMLCIQIIQQLKQLHKLGYIHRDIKPDNFVWEKVSDNGGKIKLIDFGFTKPYVTENGDHIRSEKASSICGTMRYMSVNCQSGHEASRRDDLVSLAYSLIYLYKKNLPWKGIKTKDKPRKNKNEEEEIKRIDKKKNNLIKKMKIKYNQEIDESDLPSPLKFLANYSLGLKFNQKPDYSFIIKVFNDYIKKNNSKYDGKWSWLNDDI